RTLWKRFPRRQLWEELNRDRTLPFIRPSEFRRLFPARRFGLGPTGLPATGLSPGAGAAAGDPADPRPGQYQLDRSAEVRLLRPPLGLAGCGGQGDPEPPLGISGD